MTERIMIVPPEGWRYGFPKQFDGNINSSMQELKQWLLANGYPREEILSRMENFPVILMNEASGFRKLITS